MYVKSHPPIPISPILFRVSPVRSAIHCFVDGRNSNKDNPLRCLLHMTRHPTHFIAQTYTRYRRLHAKSQANTNNQDANQRISISNCRKRAVGWWLMADEPLEEPLVQQGSEVRGGWRGVVMPTLAFVLSYLRFSSSELHHHTTIKRSDMHQFAA